MVIASLGHVGQVDAPVLPNRIWPQCPNGPLSLIDSLIQFRKQSSSFQKPFPLIQHQSCHVEPPVLGGIGSWSMDNGLAMIDGPNLMCAIHDLVHEHGCANNFRGLDLQQLRRYLEQFSIDDFLFVNRFDGQRSRFNLERDVRFSGWRYLEVSGSHFGMDFKDPVDDHIRGRIRKAIGVCSVLSLATHDGGYTSDIDEYLRNGGRFILCGFLGRFSRRLYELSNRYKENKFKIVDLRYDAKAVSFPETNLKNRPSETVSQHNTN